MLADPADRATVGEWARRVQMSERTPTRLVTEQTGMSFVSWRRTRDCTLALERMAGGDSVQTAGGVLRAPHVKRCASKAVLL